MNRPIRRRRRDGSCGRMRRFICPRFWTTQFVRFGQALRRRFRGGR